MPLTSAFTPCGMLSLSSEPSVGEKVYRSLINSLGGNFDVSPGSYFDAWAYATAMGIARGRLTLQRAGNQIEPRKVRELLPVREDEYGLTPGMADTTDERGGALSARMRAPNGGTYGNVYAALRDVLGSKLLAVHALTNAEAAIAPTNLGDQPMLLADASLPRKLGRLADSITTPGFPSEASYDIIDEPINAFTETLIAGDRVVVSPSNTAIAEVVDVISTGSSGGHSTFTATFANAHSAGELVVAMPFPLWVSTKRHDLVMVDTLATANDPEWRRKIDEVMVRMVRGVSTWSIIHPTGAAGHTGTFTVDGGLIGIQTIGDITY